MRWLMIIVASIALSTRFDVSAISRAASQAARDASPRVVLVDNPRVRVYRTTAGLLTGEAKRLHDASSEQAYAEHG